MIEYLWKRENKKIIHKTRIYDLISYDCTSPDKKINGEFYIIEAKNWVNIIPITSDKKVILVRQYRHGIHDISLELPGGIIEFSNEDAALNGAKAELREETGYTSNNWNYLGKVSSNPAILNNWTYSFIAENIELTNIQELDPYESLEIEIVNLYDLPHLVEKGAIHHSLMVSTIGMYFMLNKI